MHVHTHAHAIHTSSACRLTPPPQGGAEYLGGAFAVRIATNLTSAAIGVSCLNCSFVSNVAGGCPALYANRVRATNSTLSINLDGSTFSGAAPRGMRLAWEVGAARPSAPAPDESGHGGLPRLLLLLSVRLTPFPITPIPARQHRVQRHGHRLGGDLRQARSHDPAHVSHLGQRRGAADVDVSPVLVRKLSCQRDHRRHRLLPGRAHGQVTPAPSGACGRGPQFAASAALGPAGRARVAPEAAAKALSATAAVRAFPTP
jgi:hypothetical protein